MDELTNFQAGALVQEVKQLNKVIGSLEHTLEKMNEGWMVKHDNLEDRVLALETDKAKLRGYIAGGMAVATLVGTVAGYLL